MSPADAIERLRDAVTKLQRGDPQFFVRVIDLLLENAVAAGASDIHIQPADETVQISWRLDGLLTPVASWFKDEAASLIARLKVMAELLTYQTDVPQEGRIRAIGQRPEMRVSVFPSVFGERAVVRVFGSAERLRFLSELGFDTAVEQRISRIVHGNNGLFLIAGPAGSGKTTTLYACLREIVRRTPGRCVVTVEDPVEARVQGAAQSQIRPASGFDFPTALRSLMRQDPDVIVVGEIRDAVTAQTAFQAALTGHLVLATFHSGNAATAICRLLDMGLEPFVLRSALIGVICQRLLRAFCNCVGPTASNVALPPFADGNATRLSAEAGCEACGQSGYRERFPIAEFLALDSPDIADAILQRADASAIEKRAVEAGMKPLAVACQAAVAQGKTSDEECLRVMGRSLSK